MASYDDLNTRQIFTVAIISVALTFITILACQVIYYALAERQEEHKVQQGRYTEGNAVLEAQAKALQSYGVNEETGQVQVPVDVVMSALAEEQTKKANENQQTEASET